MHRPWIGFAPYVVVSIVHVIALTVGSDAVAAPTKLLLMPLLALAVVWWLRGSLTRTSAPLLLLLAIGLSWLGDAAGAFFPFAPTLPLMLAFFGLAHLVYIRVFSRHLAVRPLPSWALVYVVWWAALVFTLWPFLGSLQYAVAAYGIVLGLTAVAATRCHPLVVAGAVLFLASDSLLAFQLFRPDLMPTWSDPLIMLTYTAGQGLIAAGAAMSVTRTLVAPARAAEVTA